MTDRSIDSTLSKKNGFASNAKRRSFLIFTLRRYVKRILGYVYTRESGIKLTERKIRGNDNNTVYNSVPSRAS